MRKIRLILLNIILILAAVELVGLGYGYLFDHQSYLTMGAAKRAAGADLFQDPSLSEDPLPKEGAASNYRLHPYFGFSHNPEAGKAFNNHGFREKVRLPYEARPGELRVAVFGGSVAYQLAGTTSARAILSRGLLGQAREKGYEKVRIINLSQISHRMPQTYLAYMYFFDSFDAAVFLDGFNEVVHLPPPGRLNKVNRSFFLPSGHVYKTLNTAYAGPENLAALYGLMELKTVKEKWLEFFSRAPWKYSMAAHEIWLKGHRWLERKTERLRRQAVKDLKKDTLGRVNRRKMSPEEVLERYFGRLAGYYQKAAALARAFDKPFVQFLQPNQYLLDSKTFSSQEKASALSRGTDKGLVERINFYYQRLRMMSARLEAEGVGSVDLTQVFAQTGRTVYSDSCCHLNERGLRLVAKAMVEELDKRSWLADLRPAQGRP